MTEVNRQFLLNARPVGEVKLDDLRIHEATRPTASEGEVLIKLDYLAVEPAMRGWMENRSDYLAPLQIGDVMRSFGLGTIEASEHPDYQPGQRVSGLLGMQEYAVVNPATNPLTSVDDDIDSEAHLGVLGITGLTAYCGMKKIAVPREGDTLLVSGAAGATGSIVGQLGRLAGCRVVGTAGTQAKCRWLVDELGFDAAINYREEPLAQRLDECFPEGIDIYWDNVGGDLLDLALERLAMQARVVVCGGISRYNATGELPGPRQYFNLVFRNALMQGFVVSHYHQLFPEALAFLKDKLQSGELLHREDVLCGFTETPRALRRLFRGENLGKQLVKL